MDNDPIWWGHAAAKAALGCVSVIGLSCGIASANDATSTGSPWPGAVWTPGPAEYDVAIEEDRMVTMSDGKMLSVSIAFPADPVTGEKIQGPFPVLLTQTPYLSVTPDGGNYFVQRGYIFVTANVRGTTGSEGDFEFLSRRDARDGAELVEWVATELEGSNGDVGLYGGSYMGLTQIFTVAELGAGSPVKAIAPTCMGAEMYREVYFSGGIPTQTLNFQRVIGEAMAGRTAATGEAFVAEVLAGGDRAFDGAYWALRNSANAAQAVANADVPVLLWSTNDDIYAQGSLELYAYLQNAHAGRPVFSAMDSSQNPTGRIQIVMGQGGHCESIEAGILLEWYDTWLKNAPTRMADTALPIHAHEMISDNWLNLGTFPPVQSYTRLFLNENGTLSSTAPDDPGLIVVAYGPEKEAARTWETPVFQETTAISGPMSATFFASSDRTDLMVTATLEIVDRTGAATPLSAGTVLASMADLDQERSWKDTNGLVSRPYPHFKTVDPVEPGAIKAYNFSLSTRFAQIPAGSHLRLSLTSQTPTGECQQTLGVNPCFPTMQQQANLEGSTATIHVGRDQGSSINLPLVAGDCWMAMQTSGAPFWNNDPRKTDDGVCQSVE